MKEMNSLIRVSLIIFLLLSCTACTTLDVADDPILQTSGDPLVGLNRGVYAFNNTADKAVLKPVAKAYSTIIPNPARKAVGHFFSNLGEPLNALNNLLQGKVDGALTSTYRFAVNSTIGVFGLFDVAKSYQVARKYEDFGQTLAVWGVKPGPYLVLPFLGPSNLRDGFGFSVDNLSFNSSAAISDDSATRVGLTVLNVIDVRSGLLVSVDLIEHQLDPYIFLKEAYEQTRLNSIYDGNPPVRSDDDLDF
jgi:phospholipid-binding lipoprotein MlaA